MSTLALPIDCSATQSSSICIAFSNYLTCLFNAQNPWIASWRFALAGNFPEPIDCLSTHTGRLPFDRTVPAFLVTNFLIPFCIRIRSRPICAFLRLRHFAFSYSYLDSLLFLLCESFSQFAARKPVPGSCSRSIKKTSEDRIFLRRRRCISFLNGNKKARSTDCSVWIELYFSMAGVAGVEPTSTVLETVVLPLNYTPECLISISGYGHGMQPKK